MKLGSYLCPACGKRRSFNDHSKCAKPEKYKRSKSAKKIEKTALEPVAKIWEAKDDEW